MPELPEAETVRAGLADALTGATVTGVEVRDPRALKRHLRLGAEGVEQAAADFTERLTGQVLGGPTRRGKFLWVPLGSWTPEDPPPTEALLAHLGMSGQLLLRTPRGAQRKHVRVQLRLKCQDGKERRLDFNDQRLFGSLAIDALVATADGAAGGQGTQLALLPGQAAHIARDPLDPAFDEDLFQVRLARRRSAVKTVLLDQQLASGIGNIYADEALWLAEIHPLTLGAEVSRVRAARLLDAVRSVFVKALTKGGTSFDQLYVGVDGQAGSFGDRLNAYRRAGRPCARCGTRLVRIKVGGRSSTFCPQCQTLD